MGLGAHCRLGVGECHVTAVGASLCGGVGGRGGGGGVGFFF